MLRIGQILLLVLACLIELVPDIMCPSWSLGALRQMVCATPFTLCSSWYRWAATASHFLFAATIYDPSTVCEGPNSGSHQMCKLSHPKLRSLSIGTDRKWKEVIVS